MLKYLALCLCFIIMQEFYIDVALDRGLTRIQVDEVPPESWPVPGMPQFVIEFYTAGGFLTLTLQLEGGTWYDRNTRLSDDEDGLRYPESRWDQAPGLSDQRSLRPHELKLIGNAISNYMIVALQHYMSLFVSQYRTPTLN